MGDNYYICISSLPLQYLLRSNKGWVFEVLEILPLFSSPQLKNDTYSGQK